MNQLFKQLYDACMVNTNRPTLIHETKQAIKQATLELHNRGRFRADVREVLLTSTNGGQTQFKFSIPREKPIREILNVSPVSPMGQRGVSLTKIGLFDSQLCGNWYSWNQGTLVIGIAHPATTFSLSFLSYPTVGEDGYDSWIAQAHPQYITDLATMKLMVMQSRLDQASAYKGFVGEANIPGTHIYDLLKENEELE